VKRRSIPLISREGSVTLRDLNRELDWDLPDDQASTLAGLILHEARQIPLQGQVFTFYNLRFEILERHAHSQVFPGSLAEVGREIGKHGKHAAHVSVERLLNRY